MSVLAYGDRVLAIDTKLRRYLITLTEGGEFHTHAGFIPHASIAGQQEGVQAVSTMGAKYRIVRPTLEDVVLQMPRGAQVIYPKDLGAICVMADLAPGLRVFESGLGSGALSMAMLRHGVDILGYEIREDFLNRARSNVGDFAGAEALSRYETHLRDAYAGIDAESLDRVVLDLPEPWQVIPHATRALRPGGIIVTYTPSIVQASRVREALETGWMDQRTLEVLHRTWHIEGHAVRPDHRMVAHTGFLTSARLLG